MGYRIGVDLGGTNLAAGVLDDSYRILKFATMKTRQNGSPEEIAEDMTELVWNLTSEAGITKEEIESLSFNLDQCGFPVKEEVILSPKETMDNFIKKRESLEKELDNKLNEIIKLIGDLK